MKYKIIVDKQSRLNPSQDKREYEIDIEELRVKEDVYDSLVITKDEDYVMRRLSLSEYHVLSVLSEPIKEPIQGINIELFEGDNYIYLVDLVGNKFYAEYLVKNDFTDMYVTINEMNSAINQTANQIELSVNQKLQGYASNEDIIELNSRITQTATEINLEVSKKVGEDEICSVISQSAEEILLKGNRVLIESDKFNLGKDGDVSCSNITIAGGSVNLKDDSVNSAYSNFKISNTNNTKYLLAKPFSLRIENEEDGNYARTDVTNNASHVFLKCGSKKAEMQATSSEASIWLTDGNKNTTIAQNGITTPTVTQTSLKSKKKNIKKLKVNALDLVKKADICEYNFKKEKKGTKKHIGLVIGEGYNCPKQIIDEKGEGVEQYSLTSLLWKAVQELTAKVEKLEQEVANAKN